MSRKTRKLMWSVPIVAALAIVGALAIFMSAEPGSVYANPLPGAPMNLMVEAADGDAGRTTLVLNWDAAADASGYRIDKVDGSGHIWETMVMDTGNADTTYTDDTLTAEDTRWYRVFALNSHGIGPVSNRASGTTDDKVNPGSVMNLMAMPNADKPRTRLDLSWDAPDMDGGEMIVGYEIQAHVDGNWIAVAPDDPTSPVADNVTLVTKTTYMDETDRDPGDSQLYRVRAVNGTEKLTADDETAMSADGDASKEWVQITGTTAAADPPGQVTGLTAVHLTNGTDINLYWYDPEDTGGWTISGYVIQAHRQGKKFPPAPSVATIKAQAFTATGPTLGSATATPSTLDNATWYQTKPDAAIIQATFTGIADTLDGPDADTDPDMKERWYFRVYAVTTDNGPDDEQTATPADAVNTDNVIRRSAVASTTQPMPGPSRTASATPGTRLTLDHDDDDTNANLDPLIAPAIAASTPTGKTQQIDLTLTVDTSLTTATPVVHQDGFRIDYSTNEGSSWKSLEVDTSFTEIAGEKVYSDDDGLGFDESRSYRVFAIGRHPYTDVGPASSPIATGTSAASTAPKPPTGVMASSPSLRSIEASWSAPDNDGGQRIVKYLVQWAPDDGDDVAEHADFLVANPNVDSIAADVLDDTTDDASTMATFELDANLDDDTVYVFRVAGVNKDPTSTPTAGADRPATDTIIEVGSPGAPDWSDPVLFDTTEAAVPTAVEGLTSEAATDASGNVTGVLLLWNKPSNDIMIGNYDIEFLDEDGDWVNPTSDAENSPARRTSYTDPDDQFEMGEVRKYRVRASNDAGHGPWTEVYFPREPDTHMHIAPSGTIPAQTVTVGMTETVDASMYFSDNAGAMYEAESDMPMYATVAVDGSMVTITGVAEGTATITVTATSGAVEAMQTFMVTVQAAALGAPSNVMATVDTQDPAAPNVILTWTDGDNSDAHWVGLYNVLTNQTHGATRIAGDPSAMTYTFTDVPPGTYLPAVISTLEGFTPMFDYARRDDGTPELTVVPGQ